MASFSISLGWGQALPDSVEVNLPEPEEILSNLLDSVVSSGLDSLNRTIPNQKLEELESKISSTENKLEKAQKLQKNASNIEQIKEEGQNLLDGNLLNIQNEPIQKIEKKVYEKEQELEHIKGKISHAEEKAEGVVQQWEDKKDELQLPEMNEEDFTGTTSAMEDSLMSELPDIPNLSDSTINLPDSLNLGKELPVLQSGILNISDSTQLPDSEDFQNRLNNEYKVVRKKGEDGVTEYMMKKRGQVNIPKKTYLEGLIGGSLDPENFALNFTPHFGFEVTPKWIVGIGAMIEFSRPHETDSNDTSLGYKTFTLYKVRPTLSIRAESLSYSPKMLPIYGQ